MFAAAAATATLTLVVEAPPSTAEPALWRHLKEQRPPTDPWLPDDDRRQQQPAAPPAPLPRPAPYDPPPRDLSQRLASLLTTHGDGGGDLAAAAAAAAPPAAAAAAEEEAPPLSQHPLFSPAPFYAEYVMGDLLGEGTYGCVRECTHRSTGARLAVKIMARRRNRLDRSAAIAREAAAAARVRACGAVAALEAVHADDHAVYLVQQLGAGGSLQALLDERGALPEAEAAAALRGALRALAACHAAGLYYGDVKPANFVLASLYPSVEHLADPSAPKGRLDVRLVDFGSARRCAAGEGALEGLSGTPAYVAPEVAAGRPHGPSADLWGAGVMAMQMLTGRFPFWVSKHVLNGVPPRCVYAHTPMSRCASSARAFKRTTAKRNMHAHHDNRRRPGQDCGPEGLHDLPTRRVLADVATLEPLLDGARVRALSPEAQALLRALLARDPAARPTAAEALRHAFFSKFGDGGCGGCGSCDAGRGD